MVLDKNGCHVAGPQAAMAIHTTDRAYMMMSMTWQHERCHVSLNLAFLAPSWTNKNVAMCQYDDGTNVE
jgi:hypothetical protein